MRRGYSRASFPTQAATEFNYPGGNQLAFIKVNWISLTNRHASAQRSLASTGLNSPFSQVSNAAIRLPS